MQKRLVSAMLATIMLVGITPTLAADVTTPGGVAESKVTLNVGGTTPQIFSATVPSEIPISIDSSGTVTVANTLKISNASSKAIEVTGISVAGQEGWTIKAFDHDMTAEADGTKYLGLAFRGDSTNDDGEVGLSANNWEIGKDADLDLNAEATLPKQTESAPNNIATVSWTLDWASGGGVTPTPTPEPSKVYDIAISAGANGSTSDGTTLTAGADGKLAAFPEVTPDAGYRFWRWVDPDNNTVTLDTVFTSNTSITPVFVEAWDTNPMTTAEAAGIGLYMSSDNWVNFTEDAAGKVPEQLTLPTSIGGVKSLYFEGNYTGIEDLGLKEVTVPASYNEVRGRSLVGCPNVEMVRLQADTTMVYGYIFDDRTSIVELSIPATHTSSDSRWMEMDAKGLVIATRKLVQDNGEGMDTLTMVMPWASGHVEIPRKVRSTARSVFKHSPGVMSVTVYENWMLIGSTALAESNITDVYCKCAEPATGSGAPWGGSPDLRIHWNA